MECQEVGQMGRVIRCYEDLMDHRCEAEVLCEDFLHEEWALGETIFFSLLSEVVYNCPFQHFFFTEVILPEVDQCAVEDPCIKITIKGK